MDAVHVDLEPLHLQRLVRRLHPRFDLVLHGVCHRLGAGLGSGLLLALRVRGWRDRGFDRGLGLGRGLRGGSWGAFSGRGLWGWCWGRWGCWKGSRGAFWEGFRGRATCNIGGAP